MCAAITCRLTALLKATLGNNVHSQLSHISGHLSNLCFLQTRTFLLSSAVHERMFRNQIRRYLISNHINTQFTPPPPFPGPALFCRGFLMRNVTVVQNEVGTRALVSPVKAKDLVHPSIPLGSPSNTHIPAKYCKGTSQSSASYILMLLSGYKLLDFV